jgi:hypothetical protein
VVIVAPFEVPDKRFLATRKCDRSWRLDRSRRDAHRASVQEKNQLPGAPSTTLDLSHLRRESRTALELAIVQLAPSALIDGLAVVTGLLEALGELPTDSPPAIALGPTTAERARVALDKWQAWASDRKKFA